VDLAFAPHARDCNTSASAELAAITATIAHFIDGSMSLAAGGEGLSSANESHSSRDEKTAAHASWTTAREGTVYLPRR